MATSKRSQGIADKVLAKLVLDESRKLSEALVARDYPEARGWLKELKNTVELVSLDLEARLKFTDDMTPTGYLFNYQGAKVPDGWLEADGQWIGKKTQGAKDLYFLLWENMAEMGLRFNVGPKGQTAAADYEAGKAINLPDCREGSDKNYKTLIKL